MLKDYKRKASHMKGKSIPNLEFCAQTIQSSMGLKCTYFITCLVSNFYLTIYPSLGDVGECASPNKGVI
jgi:hypothetical protein